MKISNLVATALMGMVAITPAFADLGSERTAYKNAKAKYDDRVAASEVLFNALKVFTEVGADALKAYNQNGNDATNKKIKAAVESIENIGKTGGGSTDGIARANLENLIVGEAKAGSIQVKVNFDSSTTTNSNTIQINVNNTGDKAIASTSNSNYADAFGIASDFVWNTAWATLDTAAKVVATGISGLLTSAKNDLNAKEVSYATELISGELTVADDMGAFGTNRDAIVSAIKNKIEIEQKAYKAAQTKEAKQKETKAAIEKAVELVASDTSATKPETQAAIEKANNLLKDNSFSLANADSAGTNAINGDTKKLDATELASTNAHLTTALGTFVQAASDVALKTAEKLLTNFNDLTSSNKLTTLAKSAVSSAESDIGTKKSGYKTKAEVEDKIIAGSAIREAATPEEAKKALNALKASVESLKSGSDSAKRGDEAGKKKWLKSAVEDGLVFQGNVNSAGSTKVTAENIDTIQTGEFNDLIDAAVTVISDIVNDSSGNFFKDALDGVASWAGAITTAKEAKETLKDLREARLDATGDILGGSKGAIARDISTRLSTEIGEQLADKDSDELRATIASIDDSLSDVASEISKGAVLDSVKFVQEQAVITRLAVLANPYGADIALAKAINATSNDSFADNGSAVNDVIRAYTERFKNDNNLWGNIVGGKAMLKDAPNTDIYGVNIGYDKAFDNYILGAYLGYTNSSASSSSLTHKSDIYTVGAYARTYFDNNEIDTQVSLGIAKNKLDRYTLGSFTTQQSAKFNSFIANIGSTYGYIFDLNDGLFVKPFAGLEYNYIKNNSFNESGSYAFNFSSVKSKNLYGKLGVELRKYVDNSNYFYVAPSVGYDLYKRKGSLIANGTITKDSDDKKKTYFGLNTGLDLAVTQNLSANINFAVKAASKEQFYNGNVGLRYKF